MHKLWLVAAKEVLEAIRQITLSFYFPLVRWGEGREGGMVASSSHRIFSKRTHAFPAHMGRGGEEERGGNICAWSF